MSCIYASVATRRAILAGATGLAATILAPPIRAQAMRPLRVGVTSGPHAEIMAVVAQETKKKGVQLQIVEFKDYIQPNIALAGGELDANSYQNKPFLDQQNEERHYNLISVGTTVIFPMGIYSSKVTRLADLPQGARIGMPNDPTNAARALYNFAAHGVIRLHENAGFRASIADIIDNPKGLRFLEIAAADLPRSLADVDAAAINTNFAMSAGLDPNKTLIAHEDVKGPYANIIAVRAEDRDRRETQILVDSFRSEPVRLFVEETFKGAIIAAW